MYDLRVLVVPGSGPNLLGRDWLEKLPINISATCNQIEWTNLNQEFAEVFKPGLGTLKIATAKLCLKQNSLPRFMKARSVPLTIREKVEAELEWMVATSIIKPVYFSVWASPIVPVLKRNGQVRTCGDFKLTVNPVLQIDKYPILNIDDLYSKVSGGHYFTQLDLSDAYLQVPLDEESQKLMMINTHKGLFMYTWLCFGIASLPGVFQRIIDQLIQGILRTVAYLDNILILGRTMEEMLVSALKAINVNSGSRQFHTWAIGLILKESIQQKIRSMQFAKHPPFKQSKPLPSSNQRGC